MPTLSLPDRLRPPTADVALAAGFAAIAIVEVLAGAPVGPATGLAAIAGLALPLAWRRRAPLASSLAMFAVLGLTVVLIVPIDEVVFFIPAVIIGLYSLAAYAELREAVLGGVVAALVIVTGTFVDEGPGVSNLLFGLTVAAGPWFAGRLVRRRTSQAVALALQARELEASQAAREEAAVAAERTRIARELHDIIAHSVSVMTVQAGAVEAVADTDPARARDAAAAIRRTGQQAQADLRNLLGLLRAAPSEDGELTPQPGLSDLDTLLEAVRRTGMDVRFAVEGSPQPLPPAVDLSAFRVVQEALTNILKHARASSARVSVRYDAAAVAVEIIDDGTAEAAPRSGEGTGHGLVGMRERITLYGGELEYGTRPSGGFRVQARLPMEPT